MIVKNVAQFKKETLHQSKHDLPAIQIPFTPQPLSDKRMIFLHRALLVRSQAKTRIIFQIEKQCKQIAYFRQCLQQTLGYRKEDSLEVGTKLPVFYNLARQGYHHPSRR